MKKTILLLALIICFNKIKAQITLDNTYQGTMITIITKLGISGHKYATINISSRQINLYNVNHSLFKAITVPPTFGALQSVYYISENVFNTDNLVEYAVQTYSSGVTNKRRVYIFNESGTVLMMRDSAIINASVENIFFNEAAIFSDGIQTKMRLGIYSPANAQIIKNEIYNLPGVIPCFECSSSGTVTGIPSIANQNPGTAVFYPNPVTDQLKLKYELPKDYKIAEIKIHDLQGKLIDTFRVTDTFDFIYLPSDYNNGLYLYSLIVDGKTVKTEKIIFDK